MKEDFHIDLSNRFYSKKTSGIAFVGSLSDYNKGCAISNRIKRYIEKKLFKDIKIRDYAKLYAICIFYITKNDLEKISKLIICNDELFSIVKEGLINIFETENLKIEFEIINITDFRKSLGRKVNSLADNYARIYAKKGLKKSRWHKGKKINVVPITYQDIKHIWLKLEKCK